MYDSLRSIHALNNEAENNEEFRGKYNLVCEDHLCHETEVLYEALVSMLRACIGLRLSYIPASAPGWRLRSSHTEQECFENLGAPHFDISYLFIINVNVFLNAIKKVGGCGAAACGRAVNLWAPHADNFYCG